VVFAERSKPLDAYAFCMVGRNVLLSSIFYGNRPIDVTKVLAAICDKNPREEDWIR
jgi:hypothetical protein